MSHDRIIVIKCDLCSAELQTDCRGSRDAKRLAEAKGWTTIGSGGQQNICPAHEIPCPHCDRPMPTEVALAARRRIRDRTEERARTWRAGR